MRTFIFRFGRRPEQGDVIGDDERIPPPVANHNTAPGDPGTGRGGLVIIEYPAATNDNDAAS
jgi:hypothetical protein